MSAILFYFILYVLIQFTLGVTIIIPILLLIHTNWYSAKMDIQTLTKKECPHCHKEVLTQNFELHEVHCARNPPPEQNSNQSQNQ